jgi:hypothetical protein
MLTNVLDFYSRFYQGLFSDVKMIGIPTGFQAFFGNPANASETYFMWDNEVFDIEIIRGDKTIAATVPRGITGGIRDFSEDADQEWSAFSRVFPLIQSVNAISSAKLKKRLPGEPPYMATGSPDRSMEIFRLRGWAAKEHGGQMRRQMHTFELLASLSVLEGKMPAILDSTNSSEIYDFHRNSDNTYTVPTEWNDAGVTLATILGQIDENACDKVDQNGKAVPDMTVIGRKVFPILQSKTGFFDYFDNRRVNQGRIDMNIANDLPERFRRFVGPGGFQPRGVLMTPNGRELWMFSSNQYYERPSGTINFYMPEDQMLVASSSARADRYFGPGEFLPPTSIDEQWYQERFGFSSMDVPMPENTPAGDIFDSRMFTFSAMENDKKIIRTILQSGPIFGATQTDAFATLKGLYVAP